MLRRRGFFTGRPVRGAGPKDLSWLRSDGSELGVADWENSELRVLGMLLLGEATDEVDEQGRPTVGDSLLLLLNGGDRPSYFELPAMSGPGPLAQGHRHRPSRAPDRAGRRRQPGGPLPGPPDAREAAVSEAHAVHGRRECLGARPKMQHDVQTPIHPRWLRCARLRS